ncbi:hypothetical protein B0H14DRAFT_3145296 [Mycena olivaceomarginata]|nr:hypothetical protein B0H14DRAFT_3145296 [Mycena olivaceomarginata]
MDSESLKFGEDVTGGISQSAAPRTPPQDVLFLEASGSAQRVQLCSTYNCAARTTMPSRVFPGGDEVGQWSVWIRRDRDRDKERGEGEKREKRKGGGGGGGARRVGTQETKTAHAPHHRRGKGGGRGTDTSPRLATWSPERKCRSAPPQNTKPENPENPEKHGNSVGTGVGFGVAPTWDRCRGTQGVGLGGLNDQSIQYFGGQTVGGQARAAAGRRRAAGVELEGCDITLIVSKCGNPRPSGKPYPRHRLFSGEKLSLNEKCEMEAPSVLTRRAAASLRRKRGKMTENDRKDLLDWQQDIPLVGSRNLEDRKETLSIFSMLRECDGAEKTTIWNFGSMVGVDQMELFDLAYKEFKGQQREKQVHSEHSKQSRGICPRDPKNEPSTPKLSTGGSERDEYRCRGTDRAPVYALENCGSLLGRGQNITAAQAVNCCERPRKEFANFEEERRGKQMGMNLHGVIAPPRSHFDKERLIIPSAIINSSSTPTTTAVHSEAQYGSLITLSPTSQISSRTVDVPGGEFNSPAAGIWFRPFPRDFVAVVAIQGPALASIGHRQESVPSNADKPLTGFAYIPVSGMPSEPITMLFPPNTGISRRGEIGDES